MPIGFDCEYELWTRSEKRAWIFIIKKFVFVEITQYVIS
jgi:hypothetical protein